MSSHDLVISKKAFGSIWHEGLLYKWMESGVGVKTYVIIKSMYTNNNKCLVHKIGGDDVLNALIDITSD
jgi:hypothetical protein